MAMRLRTKLFLMFSLLSLGLVTLVTALTYWLASAALVSEIEERSDHAASRVDAYVDLRGQRARQTVAAVSRDPSLRRALALIASSVEEPTSPNIVGLAESLAGATDLDILEILDGGGTVLSSAHWKAYYGKPHREAVALARGTGGSYATAIVDVRGRPRVSLLSARELRVGGSEFFVVGGYYMDAQSLQELENLLDVEVTLVTLAGAGSTGAEEPPAAAGGVTGGATGAEGRRPQAGGAPGSPAPSIGAAQGASFSATTHVLREVSLPHFDEKPIAKYVVGVSKARLQRLAGALRRGFLYSTAAALVLSWLVALILARSTTRRIELLAGGARRVAAGDLESTVPGEGADELGRLIKGFNRMILDLKESRTREARMERIAAWREVARRIAHEIKNALSPIQLSIENIQRSHAKGVRDFDEVLSRATGTVREEVEGLRKMVDEFSQLARMPAPTLGRHDLRRVVERVVVLHEGSKQGVSVTAQTPDEPLEAHIDPDQISRALGNVVANAIDACSKGGSVRVTLSLRGRVASPAPPRARIEVRDTGGGLTPEQMERIFEPYYTTKEGGTGLGLAIAMKIVTDHGGAIEVESEPGAGATFIITLPAG